MDSDSFYVYLPSNSDQTQNDPADFAVTFKSDNPFTLSADWEIGLSELSLPQQIYNITQELVDSIVLTKKFLDNPEETLSFEKIGIKPNFYTVDTLLKHMNRAIRNLVERSPRKPTFGSDADRDFEQYNDFRTRFYYKASKNKVFVKIAKGEKIEIKHPLLRYMLGMSEDDVTKLDYQCNMKPDGEPFLDYSFSHHPDLFAYKRKMYIYCNIITPSHIGATFAPILKTLSLKTHSDGNLANDQTYTFNPIQYHRPSIYSIKKIAIEIRDSLGNLMHFEKGTTIITLHIKYRADSLDKKL